MIGRGTGLTVRGGKISSGLREDPEEKKKVDLREDPPGEKKDPPTETDPKPAMASAIEANMATFEGIIREKDLWFLDPNSDKFKREYEGETDDEIKRNVQNRIKNLYVASRVNSIYDPQAVKFIEDRFSTEALIQAGVPKQSIKVSAEDLLLDTESAAGSEGEKARRLFSNEAIEKGELSEFPEYERKKRSGLDAPRMSILGLTKGTDFYKQVLSRDEGFQGFQEYSRGDIPQQLKEVREKYPDARFVEGGIKIVLPRVDTTAGGMFSYGGIGEIYVGGTTKEGNYGPRKFQFRPLTQDDFPVVSKKYYRNIESFAEKQQVNNLIYDKDGFGRSLGLHGEAYKTPQSERRQQRVVGYYTVSKSEVERLNSMIYGMLLSRNEADNQQYINDFLDPTDEGVKDPYGNTLLTPEERNKVFAATNKVIEERRGSSQKKKQKGVTARAMTLSGY